MTSPRDAPVGAQLVLLREPSPLLLHKRELLLLHHGRLQQQWVGRGSRVRKKNAARRRELQNVSAEQCLRVECQGELNELLPSEAGFRSARASHVPETKERDR